MATDSKLPLHCVDLQVIRFTSQPVTHCKFCVFENRVGTPPLT